MSKILIITEKYSQATDTAMALFGNPKQMKGNFGNDEVYIQALAGHILRAKEPKELIKDLKWSYDILPLPIKEIQKVVSEDKKNIFENINQYITKGNFDYIISSTDPDREGSNLFWEIIELIGKKVEVKRFMPTSKDPEYIKNNVLTRFVDTNKDYLWYKAGEGRLFMDYHFGMNNTILFSLKMNELVPLGRVKIGVLLILSKREQEREEYISLYGESRNFYGLKGYFSKNTSSYDGNLQLDSKIYDKKEIEKIQNTIKSSGKGEIVSIDKNEKISYAYKPYKLSTLQKECSQLFKWSNSKTLKLLNHLYNENKLSTYPRTKQEPIFDKDKPYMIEQYNTLMNILGNAIDKHEFVDPKEKVFTSKELEHYGIFPLVRKGYLDDDNGINKKHGEFKKEDLLTLYNLLLTRLIVNFSKPKITNELVIETKVGNYKFKTTQTEIVDEGFKKIESDLLIHFGLKKDKSNKESKNPVDKIVNGHLLNKGDIVDVSNLEIITSIEKAPDYVSQSDLSVYCEDPKKFLSEDKKNNDLVKFFPEAGIGTPATISSIIDDMIKGELMTLEKDRYKITGKGNKVLDILPEKFKDLLFTAQLEKNLDDIASGKITLESYIEEIYKEITNDIRNNIKNIQQTEKKGGAEELKDHKCTKCNQGHLVKVLSQKNNKYYVLCSTGKEKCDFIAEWNNEKSEIIEKKEGSYGGDDFGEKCPNCNNNLIENKMTVFCSKNCGFTIWKEKNKLKLTKKVIKELIKNGFTKDKVEGFVSATKGTTYGAYLKLDKKTGRLDIDFSPIK